MPSSTIYKRGTVVQVAIRFSAGQGVKRRPAVVLTGDDYHASRADAIVVALTTNLHTAHFGDCPLQDWASAGLPLPSKTKGTLATVERATIQGQYGTLTADDLNRVEVSVQSILGLT